MAQAVKGGIVTKDQLQGTKYKSLELRVCHLYPDLMDTYGDKGNILTLKYRCEQRGIKVSLTNLTLGSSISTLDFDLFFFGGGQDQSQVIVGNDLKKHSEPLKKAIEKGAVLLSVCGGYQLLQKYFKTLDGQTIQGIGLFDAHTESSTIRMIGNLAIELNSALVLGMDASNQLVGFENHSGKTLLGPKIQPLGTVIKGYGNNGEDKTEGAIYKNAFGCYLHGSLLPKNPHFADFLIAKALERRYGIVRLTPLDDTIEWQAHKSAINNA